MKKSSLLARLAFVFLGSSIAAWQTVDAATISADLSSPPVYTATTISNGVADWAYFGIGGDPSAVTVKSGGPGCISAITGGLNVGSDSRIFLEFSGGTPVSSITTGREFVFAGQSNAASLSFSATILAPNQIIQIYLTGYNSRADFTVTLDGLPGGVFELNEQLLPYTDDASADGTGTGHTYGLLTLLVSDATPGDVLTFNVANYYEGVSDSSNGLIGVQAVVVVPEPSALLLGATGVAGLTVRRRR